MTRKEYLVFVQQESQKMLDLLEKKNSDYCGAGDDAFHNLSGCERLGVCSTETGVIIRMFDKFSRLTSFVTQGDLKVKDETVEDTLRDVVGYSYLLLGYLKNKKNKANELKLERLPSTSESRKKWREEASKEQVKEEDDFDA